jgi:hypothetical protein
MAGLVSKQFPLGVRNFRAGRTLGSRLPA